MITFSTWTNPATGAVRVYINGLAMAGSAKVWVEQCERDSLGFDFNIRARGVNLSRGEAGNLKNDAEAAMTEAAGQRLSAFADVLALATK